MNSLYFQAISDKIIKENLKLPKNTKIEYRMTDKYGNTEYTVVFTNNKRAAWIAKYNDTYYGNVVKNVVEQDKYTYIDVFKTLRENAKETLKALKGTATLN